jgi:hypothetical protein
MKAELKAMSDRLEEAERKREALAQKVQSTKHVEEELQEGSE